MDIQNRDLFGSSKLLEMPNYIDRITIRPYKYLFVYFRRAFSYTVSLMHKTIIIILFFLFSTGSLIAQYTFRGRVTKSMTGEVMQFGSVHVPTSAPREQRIGKKVAEIDTQGYFSVSLKDSANIRITIDCGLEGRVTKTVSYADTLINFIIHTECRDFNKERANRDISENKISLLYNGTICDKLAEQDSVFEKKYNILYINFMDNPEWYDCIKEYNSTIANHLDNKFGKAWRNDVKKNIKLD